MAADNTGRLCARCERAARDKLIAPPQVPAEFWQSEQFKAAFAAQHMGWVARTFRVHPYHHPVYGPSGISQTLLGHWLGLRQSQISRIETGPPIRDLDTLAYWARVLQIPAGLLWFRLLGEHPPVGRSPTPDHTAAMPFVGMRQTDPLRLVPMNTGSSQDVALANYLSQPDEAIALARQGQAALQNATPHPDLEARLLAMEARGFAGRQEPRECVQLLIRAEDALGKSPTELPSPWISRFDMGSLASEAARCMRQLGSWAEAQRQAEQIVRLRSSNRTRSRALGQLTLVAALVERQKLDEACAIAKEVINSTQSLGSFLVIEQLRELQRLLQSHRANSVVGEFLACLDEALHERQWLCQWLTKDRQRFNSGHWEIPQ